MTPDEVLELYLSLKLHFTSDNYDFFKYHGRTSRRKKGYEERADKGHIFRLSRKYRDNEMQGLIVSNLLKDPQGTWPGSLTSDDSKKTFLEWQQKQQSLSYHIKAQLGLMGSDLGDLFIVRDGQHPGLLKLYLAKTISLETLCIILKMMQMQSYWDMLIQEKVIWPDISRLIDRYTPFLNYDKSALAKIFQENWLDKIPEK